MPKLRKIALGTGAIALALFGLGTCSAFLDDPATSSPAATSSSSPFSRPPVTPSSDSSPYSSPVSYELTLKDMKNLYKIMDDGNKDLLHRTWKQAKGDDDLEDVVIDNFTESFNEGSNNRKVTKEVVREWFDWILIVGVA